ncbi:DUF868 domain-containing protein [Cephalotus follicularis]|uniref:DUF868 domain-containing protein n=1 Tax=Cephalotus follicularis TaxID=3775 RepID=A0A1Q3AVD1_CEPFO|nr:DUF868 domain-containing protein [Cephalotus follicularis]
MLSHLQAAGLPSIPKPPSTDKQPEDASNKTAQSYITCIYLAKVAELCRNVTATWSKSLINHSLCINVEKPSDDKNPYTCKIDLNSWQFWGKKGLKNFEVDGKRVDVFWDFRQAKFSGNPEPCSDYYVAVVSDEEVVLLLGDLKKDAYKRTKTRPSLTEATLLCKKENVYGRKLICTKAALGDCKKEHDIVIENSLSGPGDPEMWISIDGTVAIRIMNLNWRFRGNEIVTVNNLPIQIFWDVHDWLFGSHNSSHGVFIFKPGELNCAHDSDSDSRNGLIDNSTEGSISPTGFCHILYAWKVE